MSLLWVTRFVPGPETAVPMLGVHLGFRWGDGLVITTACGLELQNPDYGDPAKRQWGDADYIVAADPPALTLCPECRVLTVQQVDDLYGQWMKGEVMRQ
jgi:hypothetical protein